MKDEIFYGIKNAIDRGTPLEQAAQSFINAGYNEMEVREVAKLLKSGASDIVFSDNKTMGQSLGPSTEVKKVMMESPGELGGAPVAPKDNEKRLEPKKSKTGLIIMIAVASLILLGSVGFLLWYYLLS